MKIKKSKKADVFTIELRETSLVWIMDPVSNPDDVTKNIKDDTDLIIFELNEDQMKWPELERWDVLSQEYKEKGTILIFAQGESQIKEVHLKGSSLDKKVQYVLEVPEGTIGLFAGKPGESFVKQYAPLDILIGKDMALAENQLDFEPFYVILPSVSDEYKKKTGLSEIKSTEKVTIKRIDASARDTSAVTEVYTLG